MNDQIISRRQLLRNTTAMIAGAALNHTALAQRPAKGSPTDLVPLGKHGPRICRLGFGTGTNGGQVQRDLGHDAFRRLLRYAYDRGITFIDTADAYGMHGWVRDAIKGLPREKLFIQTKVGLGEGAKTLETLDRFRKELDTEYVDCLLLHAVNRDSWHEDLRPMMDALSQAKERKIIRIKGVSAHGLPGLRRSTKVDWVDVQLARINPQGHHVDGADGTWNEPGSVPDAARELRAMHDTGRGIVGMKIMGNGDFRNPDDRERSIRYAMTCGFVDAIVIGFASPAEIDEAIERMNRALNA